MAEADEKHRGDSDERQQTSEQASTQAQIDEIEQAMYEPDFWADKDAARAKVRELEALKDKLAGIGKYDRKNAVISIFSGAGGTDAEDFTRMLLEMYQKYLQRQNWSFSILEASENEHNGFRNVAFEVTGKGAYGVLKNESGVHRLVRQSPFNSDSKRHTSFSLVEVVPKFETASETDIELADQDLDIEFTRSSGPGGQNANKRETAVRITHTPTNLSASAESERTQERNKDRALSLLKAKIYRRLEDQRMEEREGMYVSKTTEAEWGSQIRSYVLHPYQLVKDHRTGVEESNVGSVLEDGKLDEFLEAEKNIEA